MAKIRFEAVEKRFRDTPVVRDLNLTIEDNEFFTFVGPSGCGKSTILNMIAGLESVTSGIIYLDDKPVNELSPRERDVAMVFQSYALYPHMSVYENIAFPLRVRKADEEIIGKGVKKIASLLGLEGLLKRRPGELSGGQRQRVALGRAIIRRPRVFLMDEPLSNLDARLRIEMREEIKRLHQEIKITTVYVTHDQEEAMSLSSRIAIYNEGMIQQCGTPAEVYETPSNLFVAGFIGSPSMNLIDGDLLKDIPFLCEIFHGFRSEDLIIGIRPSDIDVSLEAGKRGLEADLLLLEPAGSDIWAIGKKGRMKIKGRAAFRERISPGEKIFFNIPLDEIHIFDKIGGGRLDQRV